MSEQNTAGPETQALAATEVARIRRRKEAEEIVDGATARGHQIHAVLGILGERDEATAALEQATVELVETCQAVGRKSGIRQGEDELCAPFILRVVTELVDEQDAEERDAAPVDALRGELADRDAVLDAIAVAVGLDHETATDDEIKAAVVRVGIEAKTARLEAATARLEAATAKSLATDLAAVVRRAVDEVRQQAADLAEARIRAGLAPDQQIALDTATQVKPNVGVAALNSMAKVAAAISLTMFGRKKAAGT